MALWPSPLPRSNAKVVGSMRATVEAAIGRAPDGDLLSCRFEQIGNKTHMEVTQSWFVAKVAIALTPVVILTTADVIGWLMRTLRWRTAKASQSEP
jgi:hypothetical protein